MKPMISDAQAPLLRAVQRLLVAVLTYEPGRSVAVIVEAAFSEDWASATFVGQRHRLELRLDSELGDGTGDDICDSLAPSTRLVADAALMAAVAGLTATIGETEIELPGHFVADIAVVEFNLLDNGAVRLTLEALTLLN